jgi:hypothetical protein
MCVIVDIVPVSTEQPLRVDQEQLFEEEEDFAIVEEGKWSSPCIFCFVLYNCIIIKFTFILLLHKFYGNTFSRTYLDFYPLSWVQPV